jgi:electron transfer flavoprotein alpha subunit
VQPKGLSFYHPLVYTETITGLVEDLGSPEMILFGATYLGRDLAPAVAARLATGCAADCCQLKLDGEGNLLQIVPGLGGTIFATIVTPYHRPQVATVKPGMLEGEIVDVEIGIGSGMPLEIVRIDARIPKNSQAIQLRSVRQKPAVEAKLEVAQRVVAGGAGLGSPDGWAVLEELAATLGGVVGATRPAVDEGWAEHDQMIGQSGKTIRPELYIGIGISGDMMHTVGIKGKGILVAINQDPKAPIFKQVDYGIAADYREIVPLLTQEIKNRANG